MPFARIEKTILYFVHIPKTGGSSIEAYLAAKGTVALRHRNALDWSKCTAQHMHAAVYDPLIPPAFYDHGFAILRDPLERLISEYRHGIRRALKRRDPAPPPFDTWVSRMFKRYSDTPYLLDNHIRPQSEFLRPDLRLFKFEQGLDPVFDWIDEVTQTPASEPREWKLKSDSPRPEVSEETRARVAEFYAADHAILDQLK